MWSVLYLCRIFEEAGNPILVEATAEFQEQLYLSLVTDIASYKEGKSIIYLVWFI